MLYVNAQDDPLVVPQMYEMASEISSKANDWILQADDCLNTTPVVM